jgi:hypothetical protein
MMDAVMLLAAIGLAIGAVAPFLPYRLLLQGQAYRALWPLQFIQIPVLFALIARLLRGRLTPAGVRATLIVLPGFAVMTMTGWQLVAIVLVLVAVYCWQMTGNDVDQRRAWMWRCGALLAAGTCLVLAISSAATELSLLATICSPLMLVAKVPPIIGPFLTWAAAAWLLIVLIGKLGSSAVYRRIAMCGWLGLQTVFFAVPTSSLYESLGIQEAEDVAFVEEYLADTRHLRTGTPMLYWPIGPLDSIWVRLRCNSFYSAVQTSGNMFNRGTAIEGDRRAKLTREFELSARSGWLDHLSKHRHRTMHAIFGGLDADPPKLEDLFRLCSDDGVDLIIVPSCFHGWYAATNGHLFIYEARRIRESLPSSSYPRSHG